MYIKSPKNKAKGNRSSAGVKSSKAVIVPFRKSFWERFLFTWSMIFSILLPRLMDMVFYDFKALKSVFLKLVKSFTKKGSLFTQFLNFLRSRMVPNDATFISFEKVIMAAWMVRLFKKKGIQVSSSKMIIAMSLPDPNAVVKAVLNLSGNHGADVTLMKLMRTKCTGNIYVVTPAPTLTALDALILAYDNAHGPARPVTLVPLKAALEAIMLTFQLFANLPANKSNSIVILQSGGWHVMGVGGSHPQIWEVLKSNVAGEILMTFVFCAAPHCYDVWYSTDGIAWVRAEPCIHAHARISGLIPDSYVWVRYQLILDSGGQGGYIPLRIQVPA